MKLKQVPEDFVVDEVFDLESLKLKPAEKNSFCYFLLRKRDYTQFKAVEKLASVFKVNPKMVHYAGTKDRQGVTTQLVSMPKINAQRLVECSEYFNSRLGPDLNVSYLGEFPSRIALGDNLGNRFRVVVRDLSEGDWEIAKEKAKKILSTGFLNFFDEQRFGFAGNSHVIGKYVLQNRLDLAVKEILCSMPTNPREEHKQFVSFVSENWEKVCGCDKEVFEKLFGLVKPRSDEYFMLMHLSKYKNDFFGAFRTLPKKLQTLYLNAFQSYVFNEVLLNFKELPKELELVNLDYKFEGEIGKFVMKLLEKEGVKVLDFELRSMPELKLDSVFRDVYLMPKSLSVGGLEEDELNVSRFKCVLEFELSGGAYATTLVKQLF